MEDIEENDSLVRPTEVASTPIHIFGSLGCRIKQDTLKLREIQRLSAILLSTFSICACSVLFMRDPIIKFGWNIRWIPLIALFVKALMYIVKFINVYTGGWGAADGRFWCDVRIMYVRGFNTVRTIFDWWSSCALFTLLVVFMQIESSLLFILMLVVVAGWHSGLTENQNQYDIKFQDKFIDTDDYLCLETLHGYQQQHPHDKVMWIPFIIANFLKTYVLTCMFIYSPDIEHYFVFALPIVVLIVLKVFLLPCFLEFIYYKQMITFCKLEIFRILLDCTVLPLIVMFTLV